MVNVTAGQNDMMGSLTSALAKKMSPRYPSLNKKNTKTDKPPVKHQVSVTQNLLKTARTPTDVHKWERGKGGSLQVSLKKISKNLFIKCNKK
jgi:hypothetical protein